MFPGNIIVIKLFSVLRHLQFFLILEGKMYTMENKYYFIRDFPEEITTKCNHRVKCTFVHVRSAPSVLF